MNNFLDSFKKAFDLKGFSNREEFWYFMLYYYIFGIVLVILDMSMSTGFTSIYSLICLIPTISISIRRLRDAGKNPLLLFLIFVPILGVIYLIYLFTMPSLKGVKNVY